LALAFALGAQSLALGWGGGGGSQVVANITLSLDSIAVSRGAVRTAGRRWAGAAAGARGDARTRCLLLAVLLLVGLLEVLVVELEQAVAAVTQGQDRREQPATSTRRIAAVSPPLDVKVNEGTYTW